MVWYVCIVLCNARRLTMYRAYIPKRKVFGGPHVKECEMFHLDIRFSVWEGRTKRGDQKPKDLDGKIYNIYTWAFFSILLLRLCAICTLHGRIVYDGDSRNNKETISTIEDDSLEIRFSIKF